MHPLDEIVSPLQEVLRRTRALLPTVPIGTLSPGGGGGAQGRAEARPARKQRTSTTTTDIEEKGCEDDGVAAGRVRVVIEPVDQLVPVTLRNAPWSR